ncbi:hypothetical protein [Chitinophaga nivalis]|uniref:Uncharacterized protein n=1 Tax=Chitinophaga nivalis TaxID=2991709 RepID=A0ABT3IMZ9_9BACT|nr:hypothetical protein [Chitinophaga nivalis]MCW3464968.1 hypothetical protein [Chitinophaga nivalis]MCW3485340.1 hypothetical protein [Chitinophaga nivalis]
MAYINLNGDYIYRAFINSKHLTTPVADLKFGEGIMTIRQNSSGMLYGNLTMGNGLELKIRGKLTTKADCNLISMIGIGVAGTETAGWEYEYLGLIIPHWTPAVKQPLSVTGSVIRLKDHGQSMAGETATFYMVHFSKLSTASSLIPPDMIIQI